MQKQRMAELIKKAAEIREASFIKPDYQPYGEYAKTICESAIEACKNEPEPEIGFIIGLALDAWWNDACDWADSPHI